MPKRICILTVYNSDGLDTVKQGLSISMTGMLLWYLFAVLYTTILSVQQSILEPTGTTNLISRIQIQFNTDFVELQLQACYILDMTNDDPANRSKRSRKCRCWNAFRNHIPEVLKILWLGIHEFPFQGVLSFLRGLDSCVMQNTNDSTLRSVGLKW